MRGEERECEKRLKVLSGSVWLRMFLSFFFFFTQNKENLNIKYLFEKGKKRYLLHPLFSILLYLDGMDGGFGMFVFQGEMFNSSISFPLFS